MSGRSPPLYCTLILITMHSHQSYPNITTEIHSYEDGINVNNSTINSYKDRGLGKQQNVGGRTLLIVYCTILLIAMHGCRTDTEYTRSLGYNSVCYITSKIGWVSLKGVFSYSSPEWSSR